MYYESHTHPTVTPLPSGVKKVGTVTDSSTINAPKSVLLPSLMHNGSVGVSRRIPYLLKHNQVWYSLTVIFVICIYSVCLVSQTRISLASGEPTRFTSLPLLPVLRSLKSLQRETRGQKREKRDKWSDEATTVKSQFLN